MLRRLLLLCLLLGPGCTDAQSPGRCEDAGAFDGGWPVVQGDLSCAGVPAPMRQSLFLLARDLDLGEEHYLLQRAVGEVEVAVFPPGAQAPASVERTDAAGRLELNVESSGLEGFTGRLRLRAEGFEDSWLHFPGGYAGGDVHPLLVRPGALPSWVPPGAERVALVFIHDCQSFDLAGAAFRFGEGAGSSGYLSTCAEPVPYARTSEIGAALFWDLPAGSHAVSAQGRPVGRDETSTLAEGEVELPAEGFNVVHLDVR